MQNAFHAYLFWLLPAFLAIGLFYPAVGVVAIVCMLAPVAIAPFLGRSWCGNYCPRGSFWDNVIAKISPKKPIPPFFRSKGFRAFMVAFIMTMFTVQTYFAWGDLAAMGRVFVNLILVTTIVGIILGVLYHQRTWCAFCPMGTLAAALSSRKKPLKPLTVAPSCAGCNACARACPLQLTPASARKAGIFTHPDCLKCSRCVAKCPKKALEFRSSTKKPA